MTQNTIHAAPFSGSLPELRSSRVSSVDASPYLHDESKLAVEGEFELARPTTVDELRGAIRSCASANRTLTISASRTGLTGACLPEPGALLVSLEALRSIIRIDRGPHPTVTVLPGTTLHELNSALEEHAPELFFPVDPTETGASIGGMVAMNAGGARSLAYGSVRGWVTALQVELSTASTIRLERGTAIATNGELIIVEGDKTRVLRAPAITKPATKNTLGYVYADSSDAIDLFIGAEGTLGVVSEITLRLIERPTHRMSALAFFDENGVAFDFVERLRASALPVIAIEFMDERSIQLAQESPKKKDNRVFDQAAGKSAAVFVELATNDAAIAGSLDEQLVELLVELCGESFTSLVGTDDKTLRELKEFRHAVPESINRTIAERKRHHPDLHKLATDMAVPDEHLRWVFALYQETLTANGLDFAIFGHAGNNHFHVNILPRDSQELQKAKALYFSWATQIVERGGAVAAEHGIGKLKRRFLEAQYDSDTLNTMRAIRAFFDPSGMFNPGTLIASLP
ncbi:MAG: FAD-binding oxidoreductase [Deltaproteobacteria bacterium]|nr:FAD-binding oxidoreductase [Deltaproteobacteria bacterium]